TIPPRDWFERDHARQNRSAVSDDGGISTLQNRFAAYFSGLCRNFQARSQCLDRIVSIRTLKARRRWLLVALAVLVGAQDALLQHVGRLEGHDAARQDRHFLARLGIAADALVLVADME